MAPHIYIYVCVCVCIHCVPRFSLRHSVSGDAYVAVALGHSIALVERGTLCVARELLTLGVSASSSSPSLPSDSDATMLLTAKSCVWSADGDVLAVIASDGGGYVVTRDGKLNLYVPSRLSDGLQQTSVFGALFGGGSTRQKSGGTDDDVVIGVPAGERSLLTVQRGGKIMIHHSGSHEESEIVDELEGAFVVAAASNGSVLAVLLSLRDKSGAHAASICALRVLSYAPYIQLLGDAHLDDTDILGAAGLTAAAGKAGRTREMDRVHAGDDVAMAVAEDGERLVVCAKTLVYSFLIAGGNAAQRLGVDGADMELVGKTHIGVHDGPAAQIASVSFWASNTIALSLRSGHIMALAATSLDVSMRPSREADSSGHGVVVAAGLKRELLVLSKTAEADRAPPEAVWRLDSRIQRTPTEMLTLHLERGQWDAAIDVATEHGIGCDDVFVARFEAELTSGYELTHAVLDETLGRLRSSERIASICSSSVCESPEEQLCLVDFGLRRGGATDTTAPLESLVSRIRLLQHRERIGTFLEMSHGVWDKTAFDAFRDAQMDEAASSLAKAGQLSTLQVVFHRHAAALMGKELEIVGHIPATIPPDLVLSLVPAIGQSPLPNPHVARDWLEEPAAVHHVFDRLMKTTELAAPSGKDNAAMLTSTEWLSRASHGGGDMREITEEEVVSCIVARARMIETVSGRLDLASQTLANAKTLGIRDSERLCALSVIIDELYSAVYGGGHWRLSLTEYEMMSDFAKFNLLMRDIRRPTTDASVGGEENEIGKGEESGSGVKTVQALRSRAIPFLRRLERDDEASDKEAGVVVTSTSGAEAVDAASLGLTSTASSNDFLLRVLVMSMESGEYQFCKDVMESSKADFDDFGDFDFDDNESESESSSIFQCADDMATVAVACVYAASCATEAVQTAIAVLRLLPTMLVSSELLTSIRRATAHAESCAALIKRDITVTPLDLSLASHESDGVLKDGAEEEDDERELQPHVLLKRVLAYESRKDEREADWEQVWEDILLMRNEFCPLESLSDAETKVEYVGSLLRAGKLALAKPHLYEPTSSKEREHSSDSQDPPLSREDSECVILSVGKEIAASATSLVSEKIQRAREVFSLGRRSERAKREIDALDALQLSNMMGLEILPSQLAEHSDPTAVVDLILRNAPEAWRRPEQVYEIASLLGVHSLEQQSSMNLLLARALVAHDQFETAANYAIEMVRVGHQPAWEVAQDLSQCGVLSEDVRGELSSFALKYCPDENLQGLLETWSAVDCVSSKLRAQSDLDDRFDLSSLADNACSLPDTMGVENAAIANPLLALLSSVIRRRAAYVNATDAESHDMMSRIRGLGVALLSLREYRSTSSALQCLCLAASSLCSDEASARVETDLENLAAAFHHSGSETSTASGRDAESHLLDVRLHIHAFRAYLAIYPHIEARRRLPVSTLLSPREMLTVLRDTYEIDLEKSSTALDEIRSAMAIEGSASTATDVSWICGHASLDSHDELYFNENAELRRTAFVAAAAKLCTRDADMTRLVDLSGHFGVDATVVHIARLESLLRSRLDDAVVRSCVEATVATLFADDDTTTQTTVAASVVDLVQHRILLQSGANGPSKIRLELVYWVLSECFARIPSQASKAGRFSRYMSLLSTICDGVSLFRIVNILESSVGKDSAAAVCVALMTDVFNDLLGESWESLNDVLDTLGSLSAVFEATGDSDFLCTLPRVSDVACCHACKALSNAASFASESIASENKDAGDSARAIDANTRWPPVLVDAFEKVRSAFELASKDGGLDGGIMETSVLEYLVLGGPLPSPVCVASGCVLDHRLPTPHTSLMLAMFEWCPGASSLSSTLPGCVLSVQYMECMLASGAVESFPMPTSLQALSEVHRDASASMSRMCCVFKFHEVWRVAVLLHDASVIDAEAALAVLDAYRSATAAALCCEDETVLLDNARRLILSLSESAADSCSDEAQLTEALDETRSLVWEAFSGAKTLHEDVHVRILRELSDMVGIRGSGVQDQGGSCLWGSWKLPEGDHSQGELLLHSTSEAMGELWQRDPDSRFSLSDLSSATDASTRFVRVVGRAASPSDLEVLERVLALWRDSFSSDGNSCFVHCRLAVVHRYLALACPQGALRLFDDGRISASDMTEEQRRDAVAAFADVDSESAELASLLLLPEFSSASTAASSSSFSLSNNEGTGLSAEVLALSLLGGDEKRTHDTAAVRVLLDSMASRSAREESDASALRILLPAFAASLTQRGLALDAAEMILGYTSTHPTLCTTDAGMYLLERMLRANASLPMEWATGRSMARFARVPTSALKLADEVPDRCQRALRTLHEEWC